MTDDFDSLLPVAPSSEKKILNDILIDISARPRTVIYRQNTGQAWQGRPCDVPVGEYVKVTPGMKILADARPINFGCLGAGDAVGSINGRPLQIETKTLTGRQREVQFAFSRAWEKAGGVYVLARSVDECRSKIADALNSTHT